MATTLEIIQGLAQAAAHGYDGAHDESCLLYTSPSPRD